jgi:outer membrane protein OmpA-like peptidoglycan-associated protein
MTIRRFCLFMCLALFGCSAEQYGINKTAGTAITGSALGAGLGAIIGSQSGHAGPGTAVGAAAGALGGALLGNVFEQQDRQAAERTGQLDRQQQEIEANRRLIEELRSRGADARASERGVVVNLPDVLFEFDRAALTPEARSTVKEMAEVLSKVKGRALSVEGHTDAVGTADYNQKLSVQRAQSVASELARDGITREHLSVRGYGKSHPIASNNTAEGRARNRRVEVVIEN